jgi:hypothetical protein
VDHTFTIFSEVDQKTSSADPLPALVRRVRALAGLADAWLKPGSPWMERALREIPKLVPFSPPMAEACLQTTFAGWTLASMARWVHDDLPSRLRRRAAARCARGCRAGEVLLVLPSTVFAAAWQAAAAVWLAGFAPVFRPSRREPVFVRLLAESARALGGRDLPFRLLAPGSPVKGRKEFRAVVAYGSDETVHILRHGPGRGIPVFGFDTRVSAAFVGRAALSSRQVAGAVRRAAWDATLYDTLGCRSPSIFFVVNGGETSPRAFACGLEREMARLERRLPRGRGGDGVWERESFDALWSFRASQGGAEIIGRHVVLVRQGVFEPTGLRRIVFVIPVRGPMEVPRRLGRWAARLSTLAVAERADRLAMARVFRGDSTLHFCDLGRMHEPPPSWRNGGVSLLQELAAG